VESFDVRPYLTIEKLLQNLKEEFEAGCDDEIKYLIRN